MRRGPSATPLDHGAQHGRGMDSSIVLPAEELRRSVHDRRPVIGLVVKLTHDEQGALEGHAITYRRGQAAVQNAGARVLGCLQLLALSGRAANRSVRPPD